MPPLPGTAAAVAVAPECPEPGCWGAPSALVVDGTTWLAYRLRRPHGSRGAQVVLARSCDGERSQTVLSLAKERFCAQALERPALVVTPDARWRLYVCCATPSSKHWWIDLLEAAAPEELAEAEARTVLAGDQRTGVKDPVVRFAGGRWHGWICCHPLDEPGEEDRMVTRYATSADGVAWTWHGEALAGRPGRWDARGARVTAVLLDESRPLAYYDGRASKRTSPSAPESRWVWAAACSPPTGTGRSPRCATSTSSGFRAAATASSTRPRGWTARTRCGASSRPASLRNRLRFE